MDENSLPRPGFKDVPLEQDDGYPTPAGGPKRWCCLCQLDKPLKGGKVKANMFRCLGCLNIIAAKKAAAPQPSAEEPTQ